MYDKSKAKHTDDGHEETMYKCDGSHHSNAQPKVTVPMVENNEYPIGMQPQKAEVKY